MGTAIKTKTGKSARGFASMDRERQREIASKGGRVAHANGKAHQFSSDEARTAGQKGGQIVSQDREHMARIGRQGGQARGRQSTPREAVAPANVTDQPERITPAAE